MILSPYFRGFLLLAAMLVLPLNVQLIFNESLLHHVDHEDRMAQPSVSLAINVSSPNASTVVSGASLGEEKSEFTHSLKRQAEETEGGEEEGGEEEGLLANGEEGDDEQPAEQDENAPPDELPSSGRIQAPLAPHQDQSPHKNHARLEPSNPTGRAALAPKDDPDTFAACLQIMDDNHFLIEWLAYHAFVMVNARCFIDCCGDMFSLYANTSFSTLLLADASIDCPSGPLLQNNS